MSFSLGLGVVLSYGAQNNVYKLIFIHAWTVDIFFYIADHGTMNVISKSLINWCRTAANIISRRW